MIQNTGMHVISGIETGNHIAKLKDDSPIDVAMAKATGATLTYEDGAQAVKLAREAVESFVQNGKREHPGSMRDAFYAKTGAFVRLESTRGRGSLRGCAGRYGIDERLGHVIVDEAIRAASDDSCGSEVTTTELDSITISLYTVNERIQAEDPVEDLQIGTHGVAIESEKGRGWLYPTVPVEHDWSPREYLDRTCRKAGLPPNEWNSDSARVILFDGQIFREREPNGSIQEL